MFARLSIWYNLIHASATLSLVVVPVRWSNLPQHLVQQWGLVLLKFAHINLFLLYFYFRKFNLRFTDKKENQRWRATVLLIASIWKDLKNHKMNKYKKETKNKNKIKKKYIGCKNLFLDPYIFLQYIEEGTTSTTIAMKTTTVYKKHTSLFMYSKTSNTSKPTAI